MSFAVCCWAICCQIVIEIVCVGLGELPLPHSLLLGLPMFLSSRDERAKCYGSRLFFWRRLSCFRL